MPRWDVLWAVAVCIPLLTTCASVAQGIARDRNALWRVVRNVCVPDQRVFASPVPCTKVDLAAGYAILKDPDPFAPTHFLLVPTARISGIEDPVLLSPGFCWPANHIAPSGLTDPILPGLIRFVC